MDTYRFKGLVKAVRASSPFLTSTPISQVYELCARIASVQNWNTLSALLPRLPDETGDKIVEALRETAAAAEARLGAHADMETVDIRTARPGPIKHKELPEAMLERSRFILSKLDGLAGDFNQFVDGLKRDTNPDRELRVWTYIALAYTAFFGASSSLKTPDKQRAAFAVLLAFSTGRDAAQLTDLGLSPSQVAWLTQTYLAFADAAAD